MLGKSSRRSPSVGGRRRCRRIAGEEEQQLGIREVDLQVVLQQQQGRLEKSSSLGLEEIVDFAGSLRDRRSCRGSSRENFRSPWSPSSPAQGSCSLRCRGAACAGVLVARHHAGLAAAAAGGEQHGDRGREMPSLLNQMLR